MTTARPDAPEVYEMERPPATLEDVAAGVLRNTVGGLALGVLIWIVLTMTPLDRPTVTLWGGRSIVISICAALVIYGLGDDTWNWIKLRQMAGDLQTAKSLMDESDDEKDALRYQMDQAHAEVSRLRVENNALRAGRNYVTGTPPPGDPTRTDAERMIDEYHKSAEHPGAPKKHPSRRVMARFGWSEDRHKAAVELLRTAGVLRIDDGNVVRWHHDTAADSLEKLAGAGDASQPVQR